MTVEKCEEPEVAQQPGQLLKTMRMDANVSVAELAKALKLRPSQLESLENDQFDQLGPVTFVKGYIKSYGSILDKDVTSILALFNDQHCPELHPTPHSMQSFSRRIHKEESDSRLMSFSYAVLFIALGSSLYWWIQNNVLTESSPSAPLPAITSEQIQENVSSDPFDITELKPVPEQNTANAKPDLETLDSDNPTDEIIQSTIQETASERPSSTELESHAGQEQLANVPTDKEQSIESIALTMVFNADCWVEVYDGKGNQIVFGVKHPGHISQVSGPAPFKVTLGQPQAVSIQLNGEDIDTSHLPKNKIARFELPFQDDPSL